MDMVEVKKSNLEKIQEIAIWADWKLLNCVTRIDGVDINVLALHAYTVLESEIKGCGHISNLIARRLEKILGMDINVSDMSSDDRQTTIKKCKMLRDLGIA